MLREESLWNHDTERLSQHLGLIESEYPLGGSIPCHNRAGAVDRYDRVTGRIHERSILLIAFANRPFSQPAFSDVFESYDRKWCTERLKEVAYPAG